MKAFAGAAALVLFASLTGSLDSLDTTKNLPGQNKVIDTVEGLA